MYNRNYKDFNHYLPSLKLKNYYFRGLREVGCCLSFLLKSTPMYLNSAAKD